MTPIRFSIFFYCFYYYNYQYYYYSYLIFVFFVTLTTSFLFGTCYMFVRSFAFPPLCCLFFFSFFFTWWSTCQCIVTLRIYFFPCLGFGIVLLFFFFFFFFFFRKDGWFLCDEGWDRGIFGCGWVLASFLVEVFLVFACGFELD